jgi:serine/threonine protein kinase/tetratricopeptide (TPR) repeat protein
VTTHDQARLGEPQATPVLAGPPPVLSPRPREPQLGDVLGRYVVLEVLGRGGMGTVYAARDPGLDRNVAVKLLHASVEQQRLVREAKALAKLAHPNVVAVYDVGAFERRTFIAMELVDGWTVRDWLGATSRSWRDIVEVFVDSARGLAAAHEAGLVHRDFKPDNVLVGKDGRARVLDFGLVSEAHAPDELAAARDEPILDDFRLTQSGVVMGTPAYMAPEQYRSEPADARSDQFAFAVALWESLFGERPFRGTTFAGLMISVTRGELTEPAQPARAPRWLHRVLKRALSVDPMARYPSMEALLLDLKGGMASAEARVPLGGGRYEPIDGPGDGTTPRRLLDRLSDQVVTLQPIVTDFIGDPAAARLALSRDFMKLMALDHPHVVKVLDYAVDDELRPYVVLDAAGHAEPLEDVARRSSTSVRKHLLAQLLGALGYLHRRELVHGDLSPQHVRVAQGQVKLLVLGNAALPRARAALLGKIPPSGSEPALEPARESGLIAPELRRGGSPSVASDLWTFGTIARRVLDESAGLDPALDEVLARLTHPEPANRYTSASEAAAALGRAVGTTPVLDTAETRESFLQSVRLVGREYELAQLTGALLAATHGHGSAWLVGGESGVGKSRLLDELRARAHVEGAMVVRGVAEAASGPYGPWRELLRALVVGGELKDFDASVLLPIVPELPRLLARPVTPAPELDGPSMHTRLRQVVLRLLQRQVRPVVLILEDLQWASSATLELLRALEPHVASLPLLLLGTYRTEERAQLREQLASFRGVTLERLSPQAVGELAASMLGQAQVPPALVALLVRESEGNAFFVVEVVRALAEDAGGVDRIAERALPERVLAGGMRRVLRRRLDRLAPEHVAPLRLAAALGRRIEGELLAHAQPGLDVERWIRSGIDAAVLERIGGDTHFAHDKLREEVLRELSADERRALHARAAQALEGLHGDAPELAVALAMHHAAAGDTAREAYYSARAGEIALAHGAHHEAAERIERALVLRSDLTALERARLFYQLGSAYFYMMDFGRADAALRESARAVGVDIPHQGLPRARFLLAQLWGQLRHNLVGAPLAPPERRAELEEASRAAARLSNLLIFQNDELGVLGASLLAVNLADRCGHTNHLSLSLLGFAASAAGLTRASDRYFARIHAASAAAPELRSLTPGGVAEATAYVGRGDLARAERRALDNLALCDRIGDRLNKSYTEYVLSIVSYYRGALEDALHAVTSAQQSLDPSDARHGAVGFASWEIWVAASLGQLERAEARLAATRGAFGTHDRLSEGIWHGVRAAVEARLGRLESARRAVSEAYRCVPVSRSAAPTGGGLIAGVLETALLGRTLQPSRSTDADLDRALAYGQQWARTYPIGQPSYLVYKARAEALRGNDVRARALLAQAIDRAQRQGNVMGELLARLASGQRPALPAVAESVLEAVARADERARHNNPT